MLALAAPGIASAQDGPPPDQLDPPAPGESPYPEDPSEPPADGAGTAPASAPAGRRAQPFARVSASNFDFGAQQVEHFVGSNRYQTAVLTSQAGWPQGADAVVVAWGEDFPDALSAASLAGTVGGPLLLTPLERLDVDTEAELARLAPEVVYLVGDLGAAVADAVADLGVAVEQIVADDRYETAAAVARRAAELGADTRRVLVASGVDFADALSAGALASGLRHPLLLTPPDGLGPWLTDRAAELGASETWVVGGTAAVTEAAVAGMPGMSRMAGSDRAATATAVADRARAYGLGGQPVLVNGEQFADALSGGVFAGVARRAPILLTSHRELSPALLGWLAGTGTTALSLLGGGALDALATCQLHTGQQRPWLCAEQELARQGYHMGRVDGAVDAQTVWALYAFQKVAGLPVTGGFGDADWAAMTVNPRMLVRRPDLGPDHVEIDIGRQLILVVSGGEVAHVLHTSTGKPSTPTVRGTFSVYEKRNYRQANRMYRPVFFYRGYAFHGYPDIPLHPASAGCARMYDGDMDFLWPFLHIGTRVGSY